ncbi:MAG TPA: condensation domain-containing protein, partial [Paucimonas sp.]|nr:condensation domain-containing protein [Paucimonas sp.]
MKKDFAALKAELFALLLEEEEKKLEAELAAEASGPTPVPRDQELVLSFAQQRLWFLDQMEPGSAFYNIPAAMRMSGTLDAAALAYSINEIVRRHESLRTTFATVDGAPLQVIAPSLTLDLPVADLSPLPPAERDAQAQSLIRAEAQAPFDLAVGPLVRARLIRLQDTEHIVLFTMHHIVSDGWSMGVLVREVAALYAAHVQGLPSPLPPLAIQYADFAHWQRQWLAGEVLQKQLDYWTAQLAGAPTLLALPTDRPRPPVQSYRGATLPFEVDAAVTAKLQAVTSQAQATLFMTLAAAFNILLARYSGQSDITLGTPIANRNRGEIESLIGFF